MADEESIFDPNMKKKKKTKKPFDMSLLEGNEEAGDGLKKDADREDAMEDESLQDLNDFSGMKKKKNKKKTYNFEELENSLPVDKENSFAENGKTLSPSEERQTMADEADNAGEDDLDFDFSKKKKKKKKIVNFEGVSEATDETETGAQETVDSTDGQPSTGSPLAGSVSANKWLESDRDYTYDELLEIVFNIIKEKNPEIDAGTKKKFVMRPPQVLRVGTKKSSFANFLDICKSLHRQPKHMQAFLLTELGTSGSVDANNQLIIKGRFQQKQIESVLRRYIKEYVACQTCRSPDTILQKETRLFFLQCETCGSRRSVTNIKSGFQAVTGKRAAIRAKTA
ncbi:unnamed protein product [Oppiella nova]|uniref:Eukaryotic translation initiation factor 2 subunit 2 n=1 Tax=Oppiella nova TaxID=334625 RepID=A0A7R9M934_9ACAR|nr:unnamed protein product [Oppiella nova]CAG2171748.1 unnamed protein product [Oppiella nova]